jgi:Dolichyl-phosphate-mannose-protein mannosyltransferase
MQIQPSASRDRLNQVFCAVAIVLAVVACRPFTEAGFNDDWSYAHIALNLARTGHMAYDGWGTPTVLFQAFLGSWLIKIFGFSFKLLRFSTLPFALGCGWLCYLLGRSAGLNSTSALFGSLAFATCPLFTPLATSFMTDVYGCFFMLSSLYCGTRADGIELSTRTRSLWLAAAVAAGFVGGLDRQTAYIAPFSVLLWALWRWRRERALFTIAGGLLALLCAAVALAFWWQIRQPLGSGMITTYDPSWTRSAIFPAKLILTLTLFIFPAVVPFGAFRWQMPSRRYLFYYMISSLCVLGGYALYWKAANNIVFPWQDDLITQFGVLPSGIVLSGQRPAVLNHAIRGMITATVLGVLVWGTAAFLRLLAEGPGGIVHQAGRLWQGILELPAALQISCICAATYIALMVIQARVVVFDRYLLPVIPLTLIGILAPIRKRTGIALAPGNWILLAIFALYGVAITHDYYAELGARLAAYRRVEALGVPSRQISGGLELDGWTQVESANRVGHPLPESNKSNPVYWFLRFTPDIDPHYYLASSEVPGLRADSLGAVVFQAWLPPFRREIRILVPEVKR